MIGQLSFCEIEQTVITEQGAPRPKRAFLRARIEKFLALFGQIMKLHGVTNKQNASAFLRIDRSAVGVRSVRDAEKLRRWRQPSEVQAITDGIILVFP